MAKQNKWKKWLMALLLAIAGGAITAITAKMEDPAKFNFHAGNGDLWSIMLEGAFIAAIAFLAQTLKKLTGEDDKPEPTLTPKPEAKR